MKMFLTILKRLLVTFAVYAVDLLLISLYTFFSFLLFVLFGAIFAINFTNVYTLMFCGLYLLFTFAILTKKK